jgi:hypothetical protein
MEGYNMKRIDKNITTYELNADFYIDVVRDKTGVESWIYKKGYGIKEFMFGFAYPFYDNDTPVYLTDADMIDMIKPEYLEQFNEEHGF